MRIPAGIATVAALLLAGCSGMTRIAYNNADFFLRKMANDYFALDDSQAEELRARLRRIHAWHRANELPQYVAFLRTAERRFSRGLTPEDVAWGIATVRTRFHALAAKAAEEAAPMLSNLSQEQIGVLERRLAENNAKYVRENLPSDERKRVRVQTRRMAESLGQWTGELTRDQEARVERFVRAHDRYASMRFEDRVRGQRDAVALLRKRLPPQQLAPLLARHFNDPDARRSDEFRREEKRWETDFGKLLAELSATLSSEQRAHVIDNIERFADDFAILAGDARNAA
ncbi:MAG TPA: DUF6279 family lipoprotein [Burkholderiales bacterium]|nr:DUF6279 family lipoprotein [Burkholderiales bacterium]